MNQKEVLTNNTPRKIRPASTSKFKIERSSFRRKSQPTNIFLTFNRTLHLSKVAEDQKAAQTFSSLHSTPLQVLTNTTQMAEAITPKPEQIRLKFGNSNHFNSSSIPKDKIKRQSVQECCTSETNDNFLGRYELLSELGKGSYGTVHLARKKL